ncbi:TonB-dependent receptor [Sphingobium herbicidovorans]
MGLSASLIAIGIVGFSGAASAQEADMSASNQRTTTTSASDEKDRTAEGFSDIVVTARRVEERQLTVPITINAFAGDDLDRRQIRTTDDLGQRVPALQVNQDPTRGNSFTIRGVARTFQGDPGVVTYVADVPQELYGGAPILDLQSIQVLKGPQGTLFGKNSIGGVVLLVPQKPKFEAEGMVSARVGNFNAREFTGVVNLPASDVLAFRAAGRYTKRDGLIKNVSATDLNELDRAAGRFSILYTPNDSIENYFVADGYTSTEGAATSGIVEAVASCPTSLIACLHDALGISFNDALAEQQALGIDKVSQPTIQESTIRVWGLANHTTWTSGNISIKNILGYRKTKNKTYADYDAFRLQLLEVIRPEMTEQFTEEIQIRGSSFNDKLDWVVGGFYSDLTFNSPDTPVFVFGNVPPGIIPGFVSKTITDTRIVSKSRALFGQATYDLSSLAQGLKLTGGFRYTWDRRKFSGASFNGTRDITNCRNIIATGPNAGDFLDGTDPLTCIRTLKQSFSKPTWNVNLEYQASPTTFVYVTTRRGYKSGSFNIAATATDLISFNPETLTDFEAGIKSQGRIGGMPYRVSGAAFTGNYKDIQATRSILDNGVVNTFIVNVGEAKIKGFEVELSLIPVPGLELGGYYALTDGKYAEDVLLGPAFAGKRLLGIPKKTAGLNARASHEFAGVGTVVATGNLNYRGSLPTTYNDLDPAFQSVGGYSTIDATLAIEKIGGLDLDLRFYCQNVTDNRSPIFASDSRSQLGYALRTHLDPRTYGAEATFRF